MKSLENTQQEAAGNARPKARKEKVTRKSEEEVPESFKITSSKKGEAE